MNASALGLLGSLLALAACSTAPVCGDHDQGKVESSSTTGSGTLSWSGESIEQRFRVTLVDLPELWHKSSPILEAVLTTRIVERFTEGEPGGDGQTRMPRIVAAFGSEPASDFSSSPFFPGTAPIEVDAELLHGASILVVPAALASLTWN